METERFEQFNALISGIYRDIQKIKNRWSEPLGMKAVHIFWVYLLKKHPEGLTASELSRYNQSNRSLISREIQELIDLGYVAQENTEARRYGKKLTLTQSGHKVAQRIAEEALIIQNQVNAGIPEEDLIVFYRTFEILMDNFHHITEQALEEA